MGSSTFARGVAALLAATALPAAQGPVRAPWDAVATILQTPALPSAAYVRYELPRRDLTVRMGGVPLAVPLAATAWAGFTGTTRRAMVAGDLIATREELRGVEAELLRQRFEVTGVADPLVGEQPRLIHVYFRGDGDALALAHRLDSVVARTRTPRPVTHAIVPPVTIDTAVTARALGPGGVARGNVVLYRFQLVAHRVRWHGYTVPPALAAGTTLEIQAVNPTRAVATGALALLAPRIEPVLEALAAHGIEVGGVRRGSLSPPIWVVSLWADGRLTDVAAGLKAALDAARGRR